jgi:oligopeptide transport system permease protein
MGTLGAVAAFVLRRVLWTIPILWVVVTIVFFMMRSIGGDPFRHGPLLGLSNVAWVKYGDYQPEAIRRNQRERYGLDRPWYEQYADYMRGVATLDFGPSLSFRDVRVNELMKELAPRSLELTALAFLWALVLGIPMGLFAALRPNSAFDYGARIFSSVGFALPSFCVATLLVYYLSVKLGIFPTSGWTEGWEYKILPSFTLGLVPLAYCVRLLRGSMIETLGLDYIRMARAKGLRRGRIVVGHALRNSLVPLITVLGPLLGYTITGSFIVENIFAVPGVARYYVAAALARDYTVVLGLTVMLSVVIVFVNLAVDVAHRVLDPRLREA